MPYSIVLISKYVLGMDMAKKGNKKHHLSRVLMDALGTIKLPICN